MDSSYKVIRQIQECLSELHGLSDIPGVDNFVVANDDRNALIVQENGDMAEALVLLKNSVLENVSAVQLPEGFDLNLFPDISIVIEELSHFNLFCQRASEDRELSALEMEVQSEVDKFALALEWLEQQNLKNFENQVFDSIFEDHRWGSWLSKEERIRYEDANRIAKNFCRKVLKCEASSKMRRESFREFFHCTPPHKLALKF